MKYVKLASDLPDSSRLGFGCGSIMGRVGRAASLRAVGAALDAGITHFDVARLYGYGEAEALLGEALRGRRDRVVIASKFGLAPPRQAAVLRHLKPMARTLFAAIPGLRARIRQTVGAAARAPDRFSLASARASLEESLRKLKSDYLDIFLLHDCDPQDLGDELLAFLETQRVAGKIRAYGVTSDIATIADMTGRFGERLLYQFGNSLGSPTRPCLPQSVRKFITHGPFSDAAGLVALLEARPHLFRLPEGRSLGPGEAYPLMLSYALAAPEVGVVLCSMLEPRHLRRNLGVIEAPPFSERELANLVAAIDAARRQHPAPMTA